MNFKELLVLLPCHSLEDFPTHHTGDEAEGLLAAWSALWHPALIAGAGRTPSWHRAEDPPEELQDRLLVIPEICEGELQAGFVERAIGEGACVIRKSLHRKEIVATALAFMEEKKGGNGNPDEGPSPPPMVDESLAADFLALGFMYLQVELLTRQMRYMSNIDEVHFDSQVLTAAQSAVADDADDKTPDADDKTRVHLQACFDVLAEAREHFYPVESFLIDLTLVAPTTVGQDLRRQLAQLTPTNLMLSGETAVRLAAESQSLAMVQESLDQGTMSLVGGEYTEQELPLLSLEEILAELQRGIAAYTTHLGRRPRVYGRRRYGLTPALPQILSKTGFTAALHFTLDDGRFPRGEQSKTRWEGSDGSSIDALTRVPLDAASVDSFIGLSVKMGESMDSDHVATVCFAHWPGQSCLWYDDLRRSAKYAPVLGKFVTADDYFESTDDAGHLNQFHADEYRSPYLTQDITGGHPDPISRHVRRANNQVIAGLIDSFDGMARLLGATTATDQPAHHEASNRTTAEKLEARFARLSHAIPRQDPAGGEGYLALNPCSFPRRMVLKVPELTHLPTIGAPIIATAEQDGTKQVVVEVPAMGFAWVGSGDGRESPKRRKKIPPLAEENVLRNDFFEAHLSKTTGALQSIRLYGQRGKLLSQQLGLRTPGPAARPAHSWETPRTTVSYSVMAADSVEVTAAGPIRGEIVCRGRLLNREGQRLAGFVQTFSVLRGSRVLLIEIEFDIDQQPRPNPWGSFYACRFAWADAGADLYRDSNQGRHRTEVNRIEAPHYIDLDTSGSRMTLLTGGLPYHHRSGMRTIDTLLVGSGETERKFRVGIGIDLPQPLAAALDLMIPPVTPQTFSPQPATGSSGWLVHLSNRNVITTHLEPLTENESVVGFRVRLLETQGRGVDLKVEAFRPISTARQLDFQGDPLGDVNVTGGVAIVEMTAHEWVHLEARWPV